MVKTRKMRPGLKQVRTGPRACASPPNPAPACPSRPCPHSTRRCGVHHRPLRGPPPAATRNVYVGVECPSGVRTPDAYFVPTYTFHGHRRRQLPTSVSIRVRPGLKQAIRRRELYRKSLDLVLRGTSSISRRSATSATAPSPFSTRPLITMAFASRATER